MHIAIMGSGGVGGYVGARLQAAGQRIAFIARGAHLDAMRRGGLSIETPDHPVHVDAVTATEHPADVGPVDLVLFCVKLWDTESAARAMAPMIGPHTRVLTLQNGIDSRAMLSAHVAPPQARGGVIYVSAVIDRPGVIRSPGGLHRIIADAAEGDAVMTSFRDACEHATALEATLTPAIDVAIWEKFITLAALSGATSLLRTSMGPILAHPESRALQRQLVDEAVAVGRAAGIAVRDDLADEVMTKLGAMPGTFRSSMSEDLERGKPLELQWLSGRVHALGLQFGVPTPAHSVVYRALALYERGKAM